LNLPEKIDRYLVSALNTYNFNGAALTEVSLPEQTLKQIEGGYKQGKIQLTFFAKGNHLYGVIPNSDAQFLLLSASEDTFFSENYNTSFRFVGNNKGKFVKIVCRERGKEKKRNGIEQNSKHERTTCAL
jgi:hypothetical protein